MSATLTADPRCAELTDFAREEGFKLPLPAEIIIWLEDHDCIVDFQTGHASRPGTYPPAPDGELQRLIDEAAATLDYEDYLADVEFNRFGC